MRSRLDYLEYREIEFNVEDLSTIVQTIVNHVQVRLYDKIPISKRKIDILTGAGGLKLIDSYNEKYPINKVNGIHLEQLDDTFLKPFTSDNIPASSYTFIIFVAGECISRYYLTIK